MTDRPVRSGGLVEAIPPESAALAGRFTDDPPTAERAAVLDTPPEDMGQTGP